MINFDAVFAMVAKSLAGKGSSASALWAAITHVITRTMLFWHIFVSIT